MSDKRLDWVISDYHTAEIANVLVEWELLAPFLELTPAEQTEITRDYPGRYNLQKLQALREWRRICGEQATYRNLSKICRSQELVSLAEKIESLPGTSGRPRMNQILSTFHRYLVDCYLRSPHPATQQWPAHNAAPAWQTPSTFYTLDLQEARLMEVQVPTETTLSKQKVKSVTLESVLLSKGEESQRMLVYFKGIGGSGKTTLSWHACREWAQKKLLNQFQLLIHVDLSRVKSDTTRTFADIIPYPDTAFRQTIATAIVDRKGLGVCLLLDGLDEASTELLDFLLVDLLQGRLGSVQLPELSFVMTSRPDWRVTERLQRVSLKSCIVLAGFNRESLLKFLDNSLGAASEKKAILLQEFKINPAVEGLCCHPVNAAIMSSVISFPGNSEIPKTQTKLHELLVKHFLIRHIKSRAKTGKPCEIKSLLDDMCLPKQICPSFRRLCQLAYTATLELKHLFSNDDLKQEEIQDTLGLLNTHPTITMHGSKQYYGFYHISVQEFLAAVHLAVMKEHEQVSAVKQFLGNNLVRTLVLPLYAGLTNLTNTKAFKAISKSLSQVGQLEHAFKHLLQSDTSSMQGAVAFIKCLYECQNESLMKLPETDLPHEQQIKQRAATGDTVMTEVSESMRLLYLHDIVLTPLDCLSLGYYIRAKQLKAISLDVKLRLMLQLIDCSIKEIGMHLLLTEMARDVPKCSRVEVDLNLQNNQCDKESLLYLKELLQGPINIVSLGLSNCFDPAIVDLGYALKCIIEGLANNDECKILAISSNPFNASHIYHMILMLLTCSGIEFLRLTFPNFGNEAMSLFSHALALSSLGRLSLVSYISDSEFDVLGRKLQANSCLHTLEIISCNFTLDGFRKFLCRFKTSTRSRLKTLTVSYHIAEHPGVQKIVREINAFRSTLQPPPDNLVIRSEQHLEQVLSILHAQRITRLIKNGTQYK